MKRVLVSGAAGFIGANVVRRMLSAGHEVHALIRFEHPMWRLEDVAADVRLHDIDIRDRASVERIVDEVRPEWIFHLAVHGAYEHQSSLDLIHGTNVVGTMNLVESCRRAGFETFVNTGTSSEYGFKDHAPREDEAPEPNSYYAVTKASATLFCAFTARKFGLRVPTLRLYSAFGPYEEPSRLLPTLIVKGLRGELPPLVNPRIARDFVYMEDVLDAFELAARGPLPDPGAIFNVATGVQTSLAEVVGTARRLMHIEAEPAWGSMPERSWDTNVWVGDSSSLRESLGWSPRYSFDLGFAEMIDWFRNSPGIQPIYAPSDR